MNTVLFYVVIFVTNTLHTITGFAGTMLATPLCVHLIGLDSSRVVLNLVAVAISIIIVKDDYKLIQWKVLKLPIFYMGIGMFLGYGLYSTINHTVLMRVYGVMMICVAMKKILSKKEKEYSLVMLKFILVVAGIFQGMFSSGGPLFVIYLSSQVQEKNAFRVTSSTMWIILGCLFFVQNLGTTGSYEGFLTVTSMVPLGMGIYLGKILLKKISQELFMKITSFLLLLSGIFACL